MDARNVSIYFNGDEEIIDYSMTINYTADNYNYTIEICRQVIIKITNDNCIFTVTITETRRGKNEETNTESQKTIIANPRLPGSNLLTYNAKMQLDLLIGYYTEFMNFDDLCNNAFFM